jgi:murein DD-endopeptidase MepM/ murein hydrolase activator NlpD
MKPRIPVILLFLGIMIPGFSAGIYADYPLIHYTIESRDPLYSQQQQDVESWYSGLQDTPALILYRYIPRASEDIFSVAAAFNLPYDSLASLNCWDAPGLLSSGKEILIPGIPGLFIPESPVKNWEKHLAGNPREADPIKVKIRTAAGEIRDFNFFPGEKFTPGERIRFLGSLFSAPLEDVKITSSFGYRQNPFTGNMSFHPGVDLRASMNTEVLAARDGKVIETGTLEIYGHFVIIDHDGGYQSVYGHLNEILVSEGQMVDAGEVIALSGNSGISTGPHLHFEIRRDGKPVDPSRLTSFYD